MVKQKSLPSRLVSALIRRPKESVEVTFMTVGVDKTEKQTLRQFLFLQDGTNLTDLSSGSSSTSTGPLPPYGGAPTPTGPENPVDLSSSRPVVGGQPQPGHDPSRTNGLLHPGANPTLPDSTGKSEKPPQESLPSIRQGHNFPGFFSITHSAMLGIILWLHKCLSPLVGDFSLLYDLCASP